MRLFVAVAVPDAWRTALEALRADIPGARWLSADKYHVTLQFLGAKVDHALLPEIVRRLEPIQMPDFEIEVEGLGRFKRRGKTTVLWARVTEQPALTAMHEAVVDAMNSTGLDFTREATYQPHITLCYLGKANAEAEVEALIEQHRDFKLPPFPVREFALYETVQSTKGSEHVARRLFSLV